MTREEKIKYLTDPANSRKCENCPENKNFKNWEPDFKLPCGQQHCWIGCYCDRK